MDIEQWRVNAINRAKEYCTTLEHYNKERASIDNSYNLYLQKNKR